MAPYDEEEVSEQPLEVPDLPDPLPHGHLIDTDAIEYLAEQEVSGLASATRVAYLWSIPNAWRDALTLYKTALQTELTTLNTEVDQKRLACLPYPSKRGEFLRYKSEREVDRAVITRLLHQIELRLIRLKQNRVAQAHQAQEERAQALAEHPDEVLVHLDARAWGEFCEACRQQGMQVTPTLHTLMSQAAFLGLDRALRTLSTAIVRAR